MNPLAQEPGGQGSTSLSPPNSKALIGALSGRYWAHIKKRILSRMLGLPADFAASAATSLRWRIYGVNMVRNPSPAISSVPEPLFPRWSKRVPP